MYINYRDELTCSIEFTAESIEEKILLQQIYFKVVNESNSEKNKLLKKVVE